MDGKTITCDNCGVEYGIGDSPWCRDSHTRVIRGKGFEPFFDVGLGKYVTGWGDIHMHKRAEGLDFRDHPSKGEISARRDKAEQQSRQRRPT